MKLLFTLLILVTIVGTIVCGTYRLAETDVQLKTAAELESAKHRGGGGGDGEGRGRGGGRRGGSCRNTTSSTDSDY